MKKRETERTRLIKQIMAHESSKNFNRRKRRILRAELNEYGLAELRVRADLVGALEISSP